MKMEAILTQKIEELERLNEALAALRRELLPGQPGKFAILAQGPLVDMQCLYEEISELTSDFRDLEELRLLRQRLTSGH